MTFPPSTLVAVTDARPGTPGTHTGDHTDERDAINDTVAEVVAHEADASAHGGPYQPADSDLAAIAALTTTSFGRSFLALVDAAAGRTLLALGTAATAATGDFDAAGAAAAAQAASQPLDSDLTAIAALSTTAYGRSVLEAANAAALRTLAGLGTAATQDKVAAGSAGVLDATDATTTNTRTPTDNTVSTAKLVDDAVTLAKMANIATASLLGRTTAGTGDPEVLTATQAKALLAIAAGDVSGLGTLATLSAVGSAQITDGSVANADLANMANATVKGRNTAGTGVPEDVTMAQLRTLAGLVVGTDVQAYDAELAALAGLASAANKLPYFTGSGTAALADLTAAGRALIDDADAAAQAVTLGLAGWFKVAETVLGSSAASIDFQSIPATYRTLKVMASLRTDGATTADGVTANLNNDTTDANYDRESLQAGGATVSAFENRGAGNNPRWLSLAAGSSSPANHFAATELTIVDYASTSKFKIVSALLHDWGSRATGNLFLRQTFMGWASTAAVNRLTFAPVTGANFVAGSVVSIYGLMAGA